MMDISRLSIYASIFFLLVFAVSVHASSIVLPIINQDEFQSCVWGWCQITAPAWLHTDLNLSFANYSYISVYSNETNYSLESNYSSYANQSQFCYYMNNETEREDFMNTENASYYLASNPNGYITGYVETDPYYFSNPSGYFNDSSVLNVNSSTYANQCFYVNNATERTAFTDTNNVTYSAFVSANITNSSSYLNGNAPSYYLNIGGFNAGNLTAGTIPNARYNGNVVLTNQTNTYTSNQNFSTTNTSYYFASASSPVCQKYYNVSTLLWCDCKNTTNAWMANTC